MNNDSSVGGLALNDAGSAPGDPDPNLTAMGFTKSKTNDPRSIQFAVNATLLTNMSLSFAQNSNGNGYKNVTLDYSINGGLTFNANNDAITKSLTTGGNFLVTFNVPSGANQQTNLVLRLSFSGGSSNGTDLQTVIDNIQLNANVIPEPATVIGGLLGSCGLCWLQRRRLIQSISLRRR